MRYINRVVIILLMALGFSTPATGQTRLYDVVKARGYLKCGTTTGTAGFAAPDERGVWRGIDVDFCRALAAVVLGDSESVRFIPLKSDQRFVALQSGDTDVHVGTTSWTYARDANGLTFSLPNFFTYSGVLAKADSGIKSMEDLEEATVCLQSAGSTQYLVIDYSDNHGLKLKPVLFESRSSLIQAFFNDRCDAFITDATSLAALVASHSQNPDDFVIFPFGNIEDAFAPVTRHGDEHWSDIVKWTLQALLHAEDLEISNVNVEDQLGSSNRNIRKILGVDPGLGAPLGLDDKWAYRAIKQVGNYKEIFDKNLGKDSSIKLNRGRNELVKNNGLMYLLLLN